MSTETLTYKIDEDFMRISNLDQLNNFPKKISAPINALLDRNYIDHRALYTALWVTPQSQRHRLLLNIALIKGLIGENVEVDDTVDMAKRLGRSVNIDWSVRRWKEEHDTLSRVMTLQKLSGDLVLYKLDAYKVLLPDSWPGYLIPNSRRLGMEGLKQRHCIASYHHGIVNNRYAIAVVFINKRRWTVQLKLTNDETIPLCILQIKSKLNVLADDETKQAILNALQLPEKALNYYMLHNLERPSATERVETAYSDFRRVLPILHDFGVQEIRISFDGYGDSGQIEAAWYVDQQGQSVDSVELKSRIMTQLGEDLDDIIDNAADDYISAQGVDWYNNDGGYGDLTIDVIGGKLSCEIFTRYTESESAFYQEYCLQN